MINKLIQETIARLRTGFAGVIDTPASHIVAGPISPPEASALPMITLCAGPYEINQAVKDEASSQPRPQAMTQILSVDAENPQGPYHSDKTPLQGTLQCRIIFDKGTVTERRLALQENKDFTIDYSSADVTLVYPVEEADEIILDYSFVGVFTLREFQQRLLLDVFAANIAESEQLAALSSSMILTQQNELLEHYNFTDRTEYIANQYVASHTLDHIDMLSGAPESLVNASRYQSVFQVHGRIKHTKEIVEGFGLIEKIHSPGVVSDHPIDIKIVLD